MKPLLASAGLALALAFSIGSCSDGGPEASDAGAAKDAAAQTHDGSIVVEGDAGTTFPDGSVTARDGGATGRDGGVPDGGPQCVSGAPAAPCCDGSGTTMGEGICINGKWTCGSYALCECAGAKLSWQCSDACGSDAWSGPTCEAAGWTCPAGTLRTDGCPVGLCWSEGPHCCSDAGIDWSTCINGTWQCPAGMTACP